MFQPPEPFGVTVHGLGAAAAPRHVASTSARPPATGTARRAAADESENAKETRRIGTSRSGVRESGRTVETILSRAPAARGVTPRGAACAEARKGCMVTPPRNRCLLAQARRAATATYHDGHFVLRRS